MSAEFNGGLTIEDLNHPWMLLVGQTATYQLQNGAKLQFVAEKNDNFWKLGKKALKYQAEHPENPIIDPGTVTPADSTKDEAAVVPGTISENNSGGIPWWVWVVAGLVILIIYGAIRESKKQKAEAAKDPVTSGTPMRQGGINDEQAPAYALEVANRQFNRPGLSVQNITRGTISGENLEVYYAGQLDPKRRTFENVPGYRGEVSFGNDQQPEFVYFLQGCGNDVRMGNYFSGQNIRFTPEQVLQPAVQQPAVTQPAAEQPATVPVVANMDAVVEMLKATNEKLLEKESGDFFFEIPGMQYSLKFSKGMIIPASNHVQPAAVIEAKEELS
jgi:hypothetical protein